MKHSTIVKYIRDFKNSEEDIRLNAVDELSKIGTSAIASLIEVLKVDELVVTRYDMSSSYNRVTFKVDNISVLPALPHLMEILKGKNYSFRRNSTSMTFKIELSSFKVNWQDEIVEILKSKGHTSSSYAVQALSKIGEPALPHITDIVNDPNWNVRRDAVVILGKIGHIASLPVLLETLRDENEFVCQNSIRALQSMGSLEAISRKIIVCSQLTAQEKIALLKRLKTVSIKEKYRLEWLSFPNIQKLCSQILRENDAATHHEAKKVLDWISEGSQLLRSSTRSIDDEGEELLRAAHSSENNSVQSDELLRATDTIEPEAIPKISLWQHLVKRSKNKQNSP